MEKSIFTREYEAVLRLLRQAREAAGLTQIELAAALDKSQSFVSKVERGETRLDIIQLRTVLAALGVTLPLFAQRLERELAG
ncbi:MAG TPA: helix-turn-helix transcriptional regulator [Urbifossiella sp.]|nr:helix-turn-helix transcriptional regulator [Urbifossiella sp.]